MNETNGRQRVDVERVVVGGGVDIAELAERRLEHVVGALYCRETKTTTTTTSQNLND